MPRTITDDEKELYYIIHNNPEFFRLELESDKARAKIEYNDVLLGFAHEDLNLEKNFKMQRSKIIYSRNIQKQHKC